MSTARKLQGKEASELTSYWEQAKLYWIWGIVGTVAVAAIWPAWLLIIRQRSYEGFLTLHHALVILFLVGFCYHIWYCYTYNWGYEVWAFISIAIWAIDRFWRLARMLLNGVRTAVMTPLQGTDGEYLRIEIGGVHTHGVVYLCFPTLSWIFWENHPFSVASSFTGSYIQGQPCVATKSVIPDSEKSVPEPNEQQRTSLSCAAAAAASANPKLRLDQYQPVSKSTTFIVRSLTGVTARLTARSNSGVSPLRIPVLPDGSYHSNTTAGFSDCSSLVCIAGGVGVTGVLPVLRSFHVPQRAQLFWGVRKQGLVEGMGPEISQSSKDIIVSV